MNAGRIVHKDDRRQFFGEGRQPDPPGIYDCCRSQKLLSEEDDAVNIVGGDSGSFFLEDEETPCYNTNARVESVTIMNTSHQRETSMYPCALTPGNLEPKRGGSGPPKSPPRGSSQTESPRKVPEGPWQPRANKLDISQRMLQVYKDLAEKQSREHTGDQEDDSLSLDSACAVCENDSLEDLSQDYMCPDSMSSDYFYLGGPCRTRYEEYKDSSLNSTSAPHDNGFSRRGLARRSLPVLVRRERPPTPR